MYLVVLTFVVLSVTWRKILLLAESSIQFIQNTLWFIHWMLVLLVHISVVLQKNIHFFPQVVEIVMKRMILLYLPKQ